MLIEDGVDATARELRELAAKLKCPPLILNHGLTADRGAEIRRELASADEALAQGMATQALAQYAALVADPALAVAPTCGGRPNSGWPWRWRPTGTCPRPSSA
ncbi:hypothetical protein AB0B45_48365 [Nonomuraea sp. NPDC049152]|uniref:hypothetical protein n=1 Tax=Nonomuraea sp. NPDC049152 TaxID=3154350 RepID=UPI0033D6D8CE